MSLDSDTPVTATTGETAIGGLAADALSGLWQQPPVLPTKWLYDERGSKLFDEITRLPEYYPTRRETAILRARSAEIASTTRADVIVELGSGTSTKTRLLLDAFVDAAADGERPTYVPVDVSTEMLTTTAEVLAVDYPGIDVVPVVADFTEPDLDLPPADGPRADGPVRVLTVSRLEQAKGVEDLVIAAGLLAELGGAVGDREAEEGTVAVRRHGEGDQGSMAVADLVEQLSAERAEMQRLRREIIDLRPA